MTHPGPAPLVDVVTSQARRAAYLASGSWDGTTLSGCVRDLAQRRPDDVAVVDRDGGRRHTYGELQRDVGAVGAWLAAEGVARGDVVSIQLPNCYEFVAAAVAVQSLGAVINPLLPVYRRRELLHVFTVAAPKVVFTPARYRGHDHVTATRDAIAESGRAIAHVVVEGLLPTTPADRGGTGPDLPGPADAVSELIFTSGTEAAPKAIMHTEQTASFSMRAARADLGMGPGDVVWMPSPIGHSTGFNYGVRFAVSHGFPLVLQDRWDPAVAYDLVEREHATYTLASTTFLQDLVVEAEARKGVLGSMARFGCGGAPVPPELVRRAARVGIGVLRLYGSTEVLVATWNRPGSPLATRVDTDGPALTGVEVEVRDDAGAPCPAGAPGEIFVRGPNTCVGFYLDPERTAATFTSDGWVRSGDLATIDAAGALTVVGRKKEIVIRGGMNITPREIEELLLAFPEVDRVAVVGLPDDRLGERVCACVVLTAGAALGFDDMVARLRAEGLATYKLPERLEILDALPMTASGKTQKFEIVARLLGRAPGEEVGRERRGDGDDDERPQQ